MRSPILCDSIYMKCSQQAIHRERKISVTRGRGMRELGSNCCWVQSFFLSDENVLELE